MERRRVSDRTRIRAVMRKTVKHPDGEVHATCGVSNNKSHVWHHLLVRIVVSPRPWSVIARSSRNATPISRLQHNLTHAVIDWFSPVVGHMEESRWAYQATSDHDCLYSGSVAGVGPQRSDEPFIFPDESRINKLSCTSTL